MNRKTLTALAVFVVLGLVALVALRQPDKGEQAADHPHPLPSLSLQDITSLEVTKDGKPTTIKNEGASYRIVAPVAYAADDLACKAAFEAIAKMDITDLVSEQAAKQAEFGVDDKSGIHVVVKHDDKVLADLVLGNSIGSGTMVRLGGRNEIWRASGVSHYVFDKGPSDWRDKSLTTFAVADAQRLDVAAKDGSKISLKKTGTKVGNDDKWEVVQSTLKIDTLDNTIPTGIVSALATWKTNDFADGAKLTEAGLNPAVLTVTVGLKDGKSVTVLLGGPKSDDETFVKKTDAPQVFLVKKYNLDRVNRRPIDFRDKTLCNLDSADLTEIAVGAGDKSYTLTRTGADWKAIKPAKLELDSAKTIGLSNDFKDWKASSFAEDPSPKATGLAKPLAVITAKGKAKAAACTVKVGDETKDKLGYYVSLAKGPDVFVAPKWSVDRLLVKPDDLKKSGSTTSTAAPTAAPRAKGIARK